MTEPNVTVSRRKITLRKTSGAILAILGSTEALQSSVTFVSRQCCDSLFGLIFSYISFNYTPKAVKETNKCILVKIGFVAAQKC